MEREAQERHIAMEAEMQRLRQEHGAQLARLQAEAEAGAEARLKAAADTDAAREQLHQVSCL